MKYTKNNTKQIFLFFLVYNLIFFIFMWLWKLALLQVLSYLGICILFWYFLWKNKYLEKSENILSSSLGIFRNSPQKKHLHFLDLKFLKILLGGIWFVLLLFGAIWYMDEALNKSYYDSKWDYLKASLLDSKSLNNSQSKEEKKYNETLSEELAVNETIENEELTVSEIIEDTIIKEWDDGSLQIVKESLSLWKNFDKQVKDVYALSPFTKYGSDFFNVIQLQKVLTKLWYYNGISDGTFTFETKLAIYKVLVNECGWPKASTKWVFWPKAKACIDELYISVEDGEWIIN